MALIKNFCMFLLILFFSSSISLGANQPPKWPWRGVNIDNLVDNGPADLSRIAKEIPINSVRLQTKPAKMIKRKGLDYQKGWNETLAWLDQMLDQCAQLKLACVVDLSDFPFESKQQNYQMTEAFWIDEKAHDHVIQWVGELAKRFANRGDELGGYDILSEPVLKKDGEGIKPPAWDYLQRRIIEEIRKHDKTHWIIVKPGPWGIPGSYRNFSPVGTDSKLVYSVHVYMPHGFTHQGIKNRKLGPEYPGFVGARYWDKAALRNALQPVRDFEQRQNALIWVGEFSAVRWAKGSEQYIKDLAEIFDEYGWGWAYFSFGWWHGWNPDYDSEFFERVETWDAHRIGMKSKRWQTLREIFKRHHKISSSSTGK